MNSNYRVKRFVLISISIYLLASIADTLFEFHFLPLKKINLVSEIVTPTFHSDELKDDSTLNNQPLVIKKIRNKEFTLYNIPHLITDFNTDTSQPALFSFMQKLQKLKSGGKRKLRIAYFGDSMIEGDLLTKTLRKLLQDQFGGSGVGFVAIKTQDSKFRQTVSAYFSDGWKDENFKTGSDGNLFFSGHLFKGNNDWVQLTDKTISDSTVIIEKSLICGYTDQPVSVTVNNQPLQITTNALFNRILLNKDKSKNIRLSVKDERLPLYGISFESEEGVFVDNFSFRGISGVEINKIDSAFLASINNTGNYYDLLVFQYGVNVLYSPNDKKFSWYAKRFLPVIKKVKNCFPGSDILIISTADRAFRYDGEYKSAVGIDSLIKIQAAMAYETGCNFYNQFEAMGGKNSIVEWASANPPKANKDYVHPNAKGAEVLANYFFDAMMNNYKKYLHTIK